MDKFEAMQRFVVVAQTLSFTRAAEVLGLPKSSISASITNLEQYLQTRLLHRSTRRISLTTDGETYLVQCQLILSQVEGLEAHFKSSSKRFRGELRIDMPSRFASQIVLPNLLDWFGRYPEIELKLSCTDYKTDPVKEGIDAVIRVGVLNDSSLIARPLTSYRILNCASPDYISKYGNPQSLADLAQHWLIDYSQSMRKQKALFEFAKGGEVQHIEMASRLTVNNTEAYFSACVSGLGIAQIPLIGILAQLQDRKLVPILREYEAKPMSVSVLYPSRRQPTCRLNLFIEWVRKVVLREEKKGNGIYRNLC